MGFVAIEAWGKWAFEQFPFIKHSAKRLYHLVSYALSSEKFKAGGEVVRVTPDDGYEYFYGYYDKSPWDATGRYMIAIKVRQAYKSVAPKEPGEVVLVDTQNGNKILKVGTADVTYTPVGAEMAKRSASTLYTRVNGHCM